MEITVLQDSQNVDSEFTNLEIGVPELGRTFVLDIDFSAIVDRSRMVRPRSLDFLVIAATVYAIDKIVPRRLASDRWTRTLDVSLPLQEPAAWTAACEALEESVSFLTGDIWTFTFTSAPKGFQQKRANRRKLPKGYPRSPVVSLLSGGLDSFIGALDVLADHPDSNLMFVSHYDGHVSGPKSDQENLRRFLESKFTGHLSHLRVRTGVSVKEEIRKAEGEDKESDSSGKYKFETSFRSRSLIFLGLGIYAASKIGDDVPVLIPENGPIALNLPLNPSRRGSCSTRTVHPFFIASLQRALKLAGISNTIENPYSLKTKGEMVRECRFPDLLRQSYKMSNSCGKAGRKMHWVNRKAKACGACVPCLLRRASLHASDLDNEVFGNDVLVGDFDNYPDFIALLGLIKDRPTLRDVNRSLLANGRLPIAALDSYSDVVLRMIAEVTKWLRDKGSAKVRSAAGLTRLK